MKKLFFIFLFICNLFANEFKVASYNVENLFDLQYDGSEYKEYKPYTKYWNNHSFIVKFNNTLKVIKSLNADIIALQEIENKNIFTKLVNKLNYPYHYFAKKPKSAIGIGIMSKFPIINKEIIDTNKYDPYSRFILKTTHKINNKKFYVYSNHWPSKRGSESKRVAYALKLKKVLDKHDVLDDYIVVGDLNSNYNEFTTFKYDKKLNDTHDITGINQVLNTTLNGNFIEKKNILSFNENVHFNPWLELNTYNRFSSIYRGKNNTPDHIILSSSLFDNKNISYIPNSFSVYKEKYLFRNNKLYRWNHKKAKGYSDHLPIFATFTTKKINKFNISTKPKTSFSKVSELYTIDTLNKPVTFNNLILLYKHKKHAILKQLNDRAILYYGDTQELKYDKVYSIKINKLDNYFGAKEIKGISIISQKNLQDTYKNNFIDTQNADLFNLDNQNEIISNLSGTFKKKYLYYENKRIRVYFKKGVKKPKNNTKITISRGHISQYKSKIQIIIYSNNDFIVD
jgi:endonuclease/exonuclease/phosphatase family metal-dependent hydrolase